MARRQKQTWPLSLLKTWYNSLWTRCWIYFGAKYACFSIDPTGKLWFCHIRLVFEKFKLFIPRPPMWRSLSSWYVFLSPWKRAKLIQSCLLVVYLMCLFYILLLYKTISYSFSSLLPALLSRITLVILLSELAIAHNSL